MAVVQLEQSHWVVLPLHQMDWRCFVVARQYWPDQMLALMPDRMLVEMLVQRPTVRKQASVPFVMPGQRHRFALEQMADQKQRRHRPLLTAVQIRNFELVVKAGQTLIRLHQLLRPDRNQAVKAYQRQMLDQM